VLGAAAIILGVAPLGAAATHPSFLQENIMSEPTRPYEPLTSQNAALVLIDHQVGLMTGVRDYSTGELKHNVVALAQAAKALKLPIIVTTTARDSMWGPTFPELVEALPGVPIIDRSSVNAFDDPNVAQAIAATGRKKLIFAGISLEVCAAFPAITAVGKGLDAYVAVDASGNVQRDQTTGRSSAYAAGRRDRLGLREPHGGNPERQRTTRGRRRLRRNGHALGEARRADCAGLWQVNDSAVAANRLLLVLMLFS
jgi:nicotinamidase-related amidase